MQSEVHAIEYAHLESSFEFLNEKDLQLYDRAWHLNLLVLHRTHSEYFELKIDI